MTLAKQIRRMEFENSENLQQYNSRLSRILELTNQCDCHSNAQLGEYSLPMVEEFKGFASATIDADTNVNIYSVMA